MSDSDDLQHRVYHHSDPGRVEVRDEVDSEDGVFTVRMPLASTGEVRNEGDDPLTREELDGMARQVNERSPGVFLDHGGNRDLGTSRYSAIGKVGEWQDSETVEGGADDGEDLLVADARLMDPETLPAASGSLREALAAIKSQVERDIGLSSSIGWRDDDSMAGNVDLMEASIVGIPADPRTTSHDAAVELARAVSAERDDVDGERLIDNLRAVVMGPDAADNQGGDARDSVTDDSTQSGDEPDGDRDESDGMDAREYRENMLEMQRQQTETLSALADSLREDGEDDEDGEDEDEDDEEGDEQSADDPDDTQEPDEEQSLDVDGEEVSAEDIRELRAQLGDAEPDISDGVEDDEDTEQRDNQTADPKELL